MKDFRSLTITGTRETLIATAGEIENSLKDGWTRDHQVERSGRDRAGLGPDDLRYCFRCPSSGARPGALLVLMSDRKGDLELTNIVPGDEDVDQLTYDEFNEILEEFVEKFARPAARKTGALVETTSGVVTLENWFSKATADKLRQFLAISGGRTTHPGDYDRWMQFLVAAHKEGAQVHGDLLRRWLKEDGGCREFIAAELARQYQFAQEYSEILTRSAKVPVGA